MDRTDSPTFSVELQGGPNLSGLEWDIYKALRDNGEASVHVIQHYVDARDLATIESACNTLRHEGHIIQTGTLEVKYGTPKCGNSRSHTLGAKFRASRHIDQLRVVG